MLSSNRVIWNDGGTLKDLSTLLNNYLSGTKVIDLVAATDFLYIGSDVPFNHRFINVAVANAAASVPTVEIWDGNSWVAAVDVIDQTAVAGATLAQNGILKWVTDKNKTWGKEVSTEDMAASGLQTLKIYNMYWVRLSFSGNLTGTFALKYVGHKFSKDEDLGAYYPDLNRSAVMTSFSAGKTTWDDQHVAAAEEIFLDLRQKRELWAKGQIFDWEPFTMCSVHKVASIIYSAFGEAYRAQKDDADERYESALDGALSQGIDKDEDGHLDLSEQQGFTVGLRRR